MITVHRFKTPHRTFRVEVRETASHTFVEFKPSRFGEFGDEAELCEWARGILARFDGDGRPFVIRNPHSGQVATIYDPGIAVITRGDS